MEKLFKEDEEIRFVFVVKLCTVGVGLTKYIR